MLAVATLSIILATAATGQQVGTYTPEEHPKISWQKCTEDNCSAVNGELVLDANYRWLHKVDGYLNCYEGNEWTDLCDSPEDCAAICAVDGAEYKTVYGVSTDGGSVRLKYVTRHEFSYNVGSRLFLMESETEYQEFRLLGNEVSFDVDVSKLGCGLNGALYFVSMDTDGGISKYNETNKAGAKYGTGYCDAQCPQNLKFVNGLANIEGWIPSATDPTGGAGYRGSCCSEMDVWEANKISTALTAHPCETVGQHMCIAEECGGTFSGDPFRRKCDYDGCDFNPYRQGSQTFYGPGTLVDTTMPFTVVTQFIEAETFPGMLSAIRRFYVQNNTVIPNSESLIDGNPGNELTSEFCTAQKQAFGDDDFFNSKGGFENLSRAVAGTMVLVMGVWDDHYAHMLWLDSLYPPYDEGMGPGMERGSCGIDSGDPEYLVNNQGPDQVVFSNIKFGPVGSTF